MALNILKLCAGVGFFLFAFYLIEGSLKNLSGRTFKIFLQRATKNRIGAVAAGAVVTAVLQSSSVVALMVLAFVGAGVFTMKNAMGILLGANLGSIVASWIVVTLGFKMEIEIVAYPAVCIGGLLLIIAGNRKIIQYISWFLLGFGMLFIGLSFMKTAMETQVKGVDLSEYMHLPLIVFLLLGFVLTLLVQTSSVTLALTLSALNAGAITFAPAAAIALGSETGTAIKLLVGAIGGTASKKRVAVGNLIYNVVMTIIVFALLKPALLLITDVMKISDPLIGLVTFSTLINLFGILIFLPLLNPYAALLEKMFKDSDGSAAAFIGNANVDEPETALDLFRKETEYFIHNSMLFNLSLLEVNTKKFEDGFKEINQKKKFHSKTADEKYEFLKQLQGELQAFYLSLRTKLQGAQGSQLNQLVSSGRGAMHAVKSFKDVATNIDNLKRSSKDVKHGFFLHHKKETEELYEQMNALLHQEKVNTEKLQQIFDQIQQNYSEALNSFYKDAHGAPIENLDITTAINFNRELFTSNKAMLIAIKDFLLDEQQALDFNELPVYKT